MYCLSVCSAFLYLILWPTFSNLSSPSFYWSCSCQGLQPSPFCRKQKQKQKYKTGATVFVWSNLRSHIPLLQSYSTHLSKSVNPAHTSGVVITWGSRSEGEDQWWPAQRLLTIPHSLLKPQDSKISWTWGCVRTRVQGFSCHLLWLWCWAASAQ